MPIYRPVQIFDRPILESTLNRLVQQSVCVQYAYANGLISTSSNFLQKADLYTHLKSSDAYSCGDTSRRRMWVIRFLRQRREACTVIEADAHDVISH